MTLNLPAKGNTEDEQLSGVQNKNPDLPFTH